ncbi:MAG: hypothetical protein J6S14_13660 [Clostridia bacterium]|nr:hypothetical protein [Clostridia bacterium]
MLKLNSISREALMYKSASDDANTKFALNGKTVSRDSIVSAGRIVTCERVGKMLNERKGEKYISKLSDDTDYSTFSSNFRDKKFAFCAAQAYKAMGKEFVSLEAAQDDLSLSSNRTFLEANAAIDRDVLTPLVFRVFDDITANGLMKWESGRLGDNKEIIIQSNDAMILEDGAIGTGHSAPITYLYQDVVNLIPKAKKGTICVKYMQAFINGDPGDYYLAIMNGIYSNIYGYFISTLNALVNNTTYVPAALKSTTYTTANFLTVTKRLAAVNRVGREDLVAFGEVDALAQLLPVDGTGGAITGLQYGLGEEWFKNGYLQRAGKVDVVEVNPVVVPGTQNSAIATLGTGSNIFVAAKAGRGYAPIYGVYADNSPIMVTIDPTESGDFRMYINVTAFYDVKAVVASKIAIIGSAYPSN